jgi:hypothetical protein
MSLVSSPPGRSHVSRLRSQRLSPIRQRRDKRAVLQWLAPRRPYRKITVVPPEVNVT